MSIAIVSWNVKPLLRECLRSVFDEIEASAEGLRAEVIVVDNASADGAAEMAAAEFPGARLIANEENVGFARANNQAYAVSSGRFFMLLNPDTLVRRGAVTAMMHCLDQRPEHGAVGPKIVDRKDGHIRQGCARRFPTLWSDFCALASFDRRLRPGWLFDRQRVGYWDRTHPRDVPCVSGCCMMLRREAIEQVGPLDEAFFLYGEDIDWCRRLQRAGWPIRYLPDAVIEHHHGASAHQDRLFSLACTLEGRFLFYRKHHGLLTAGLYRLMVMGASVVWLGMALAARVVRGRASAAERARNAMAHFRWAARPRIPDRGRSSC